MLGRERYQIGKRAKRASKLSKAQSEVVMVTDGCDDGVGRGGGEDGCGIADLWYPNGLWV